MQNKAPLLVITVAAMLLWLLLGCAGDDQQTGSQQEEHQKQGGLTTEQGSASQQQTQQEETTVSGMQSGPMENIKIDESLKGKLVFQLSGPYLNSSYHTISAMNASGSGLKQLTDTDDTDTDEYSSEDPARSPDLERIAFTRVVAETTGEESASASPRAEGPSVIQVPYVYVMNADGSDLHNLLDVAAAKPDWSPDGRLIVFSSDETWSSSGVSEGSGCDLYVARADGSGTPRQLTTEPGCDSNPSWSPDGTKIAFTSDRGGNLDVYVIDACCEEGATNQSQQLTNDPLDDTDPAWSPDGTQIAFTHTVGTSADVYKMDADGSGKTRLTYSEATEAQPTWSPDGKKIALTRQGFPGASPAADSMNATTGVFTMDSDGTDPTLVKIFVNEIASFPEWGVTAQQDNGANQVVESEPTEEATADWRALDARLPDAALQAYFEETNELLQGVDLHDSTISVEENLAMYMTTSALKGLDPSGKEEVMRFLAKAGYLPGIPINYADLRGIDLSGVNLSGAQLSSVNLSRADLSNANLSRASLYGANLSYADLSGANLSGANLSTARLDGVKLTEEQLDQAGPSPAGVTIPDESQEKTWEAAARRALMDVVAAARSCAKQHGGSYEACSSLDELSKYGLIILPDVNYQSTSGGSTKTVVYSTEHSKGGSAYQFDPAAGGRIRAVPRF